MLVAVALCLVGVVLLAFAPDRFVAGSAALAERWGISRVMVGVLVVGFGTSAPEMLVSGLAAVRGDADLGVGNVVGSNVANLSLVLGIAALVGVMTVPSGIVRVELPLVVGATVLFALVVQGGVSRGEGVVLAVAMVALIGFLIWRARRPGGGDDPLDAEVAEYLAPELRAGRGREVVDAAAGLVGTVLGAHLLVVGAVAIADDLGLSGGFVGMSLVAFGTSLPELVTAVAAARAGEDKLILGNLLGSNLFNCLAVGAIVGLAGGAAITDSSLTVGGVALMLAVTAGATLAMVTGRLVNRWEALALVAAYVLVMPMLAG